MVVCRPVAGFGNARHVAGAVLGHVRRRTVELRRLVRGVVRAGLVQIRAAAGFLDKGRPVAGGIERPIFFLVGRAADASLTFVQFAAVAGQKLVHIIIRVELVEVNRRALRFGDGVLAPEPISHAVVPGMN